MLVLNVSFVSALGNQSWPKILQPLSSLIVLRILSRWDSPLFMLLSVEDSFNFLSTCSIVRPYYYSSGLYTTWASASRVTFRSKPSSFKWLTETWDPGEYYVDVQKYCVITFFVLTVQDHRLFTKRWLTPHHYRWLHKVPYSLSVLMLTLDLQWLRGSTRVHQNVCCAVNLSF
jgi:hypothetical protein